MFCEVSQQISIPKGLSFGKGQRTNAVPAGMHDCGSRAVKNLPTLSMHSLAVIDVFKPYGREAFIEAPNRMPDGAFRGQACARGLLYFLFPGVIQIETAVLSVPWVARPNDIQ